jgi:ketosteroid isomerase-like protein
VADEQDTAVVSSENVELARQIAERMAPDEFVSGFHDAETLRATNAALEPLIDPNLVIEMVGPEYIGQRLTYQGIDGYIEAWRDWLTPYESFRAEIEGYIDAGDKVVMLVRQLGRTKTGGVPIEADSAVVFSFHAGKLARLEFYLERDRAMKATGVSE